MTQCVRRIMESPRRIIKRYENRKLYDTTGKRYLRLEDVSALIRSGCEIQVIDNATGSDVTAPTLARIVGETGGSSGPALSTEVLLDLVRWGGRVVTVSREQLERQLERLIDSALERIGTVREARESMAALTARIEQLEGLLRELRQARAVTAEKTPAGDTRRRRQSPVPAKLSVPGRPKGGGE
jgi:polyhydroxyalkanoate synthesis repressor PhaR